MQDASGNNEYIQSIQYIQSMTFCHSNLNYSILSRISNTVLWLELGAFKPQVRTRSSVVISRKTYSIYPRTDISTPYILPQERRETMSLNCTRQNALESGSI